MPNETIGNLDTSQAPPSVDRPPKRSCTSNSSSSSNNDRDRLIERAVTAIEKESSTKNEDTSFGEMIGFKLAKVPDGDAKDDTKLEIMRLISELQKLYR